jgi:hypothetical protein
VLRRAPLGFPTRCYPITRQLRKKAVALSDQNCSFFLLFPSTKKKALPEMLTIVICILENRAHSGSDA